MAVVDCPWSVAGRRLVVEGAPIGQKRDRLAVPRPYVTDSVKLGYYAIFPPCDAVPPVDAHRALIDDAPESASALRPDRQRRLRARRLSQMHADHAGRHHSCTECSPKGKTTIVADAAAPCISSSTPPSHHL